MTYISLINNDLTYNEVIHIDNILLYIKNLNYLPKNFMRTAQFNKVIIKSDANITILKRLYDNVNIDTNIYIINKDDMVINNDEKTSIEKLITPSICLNSVKLNGKCLKLILMLDLAFSKETRNEIINFAVTQTGKALKYIPSVDRSLKLCINSLTNEYNLEYIPQRYHEDIFKLLKLKSKIR